MDTELSYVTDVLSLAAQIPSRWVTVVGVTTGLRHRLKFQNFAIVRRYVPILMKFRTRSRRMGFVVDVTRWLKHLVFLQGGDSEESFNRTVGLILGMPLGAFLDIVVQYWIILLLKTSATHLAKRCDIYTAY